MPDRNTVYNGTWHHTTDDNTIDTQDTTMTIQFTGTYRHIEYLHDVLIEPYRDGAICLLRYREQRL